MYLGAGYKVIASYGHLRNISKLEDIDVKNNFFSLHFVFAVLKSRKFALLKRL
jgi:DNA topoisomerase IA